VNERLLSPEDVARTCGLSRRAVYDAIRRGELPAMRLCSRLRVRPGDFDVWLAASAVAANGPRRKTPDLSPLPCAAGSFRALLTETRGDQA
jgi:excisionase family DNA binding protein